MELRILFILILICLESHSQSEFCVCQTEVCANLNVQCSSNHLSNNFSPTNFSNLQGCSYQWDFGDGTTSTEENPNHTYDQSGIYTLHYSAIIDTTGFILTGLRVTAVDCEDFGLFGAGDPDVYFEVYDVSGTTVYQSGHTSNMAPPINWTGLNISLSQAPYSIGVYDSDDDSDDNCISDNENNIPVGITLPDIDEYGPITQTASYGGLTFEFTIEKIVEQYQDSVEIIVQETPNLSNITIVDSLLCKPNEISSQIIAPYDENYYYQWLKAGVDILADTHQIFIPDTFGYVLVAQSDLTGCTDTSSIIQIAVDEVEEEFFDSGLGEVGGQLACQPVGLIYTWYVNGIYIMSGQSNTWTPLVNGLYEVIITTENGCEYTSNSFQYGPVGLEELNSQEEIVLYPNPANQSVSFKWNQSSELSIEILEMSGRKVSEVFFPMNSVSIKSIELNSLKKGAYTLRFYSPTTQIQSEILIIE